MKSLKLTLAVCCLSLSAFAQKFEPGVIIQQSGDSLRGLVERPVMMNTPNNFQFKQADGKVTTYTAAQINGVKFDADGLLFVSRELTLDQTDQGVNYLTTHADDPRTIETRKFFIEMVSAGSSMKLYRNIFSGGYTTFIVEDESGKFTPLTNLVQFNTTTKKLETIPIYKKELTEIFGDCALATEIGTLEYSRQEITRAINKYLKCKYGAKEGVALARVKNSSAEQSIGWGALLGIGFPSYNMKYSGVGSEDIKQKMSIPIGIFVQLPLSRKNDGSVLLFEGYYHSIAANGTYTIPSQETSRTMDVAVRFFQVNILYNVKLTNGKYQPFLSAGLGNGLGMGAGKNTFEETMRGFKNSGKELVKVSGYSPSIIVGAGLQLGRFAPELRYQLGQKLGEGIGNDAVKSNILQLIMRYRFSK
ncbi:hypothetical protein LX64_04786 [Chitinophaga skermanii]|uniref:Outer membrane protein with beta-barrel domain n=1 Tax=Chitinophaga skermanii TaxID=331697 RepID=A0A327Q3D6_9BACT|nr:hypothetical protein [Chitinophaga skermanii]RAI98424.1 hypothetical protein LX64_04786 [Chitinophaga skermanii]